MNRFFLLLILIPFFSFTEKKEGYDVATDQNVGTQRKENIRAFKIVENDTLNYTLKLKLDDSGRPLYFFRNIFTPVCYTNECKPVHINFYWDLLGNYERYDLPEGKVLTKIDHDEFKQEDYEKLQDILAKQNSIFADLEMEDLIAKGTDNLSDSVDAKTGATLKTIKNEVIDGAVYTCFTLWKIAYGKVVPEMLKITESYKNDQMLHSFLADNNFHYQYWAMEKVIDKEGKVHKSFERDIEKVITGKNLFTARTALQKVGEGFFVKPQKQNWLWEVYQSSSYPMQIAILKKLSAIPLNQTLSEKIAKDIEQSNDEQRKLKLAILKKQTKLTEKSREILTKNTDD
ncbi:hypothetical protein [Dyadobacter sp. LHD-138]|uniref:hypothetical protein n=1 Tax=Dyadobacter sp. LHD-138 TaxID=3071413 RepID=UPI0027DFFE33|nr:hypothetical protein [Dyadobacter sp. LHD-138]MDQ6477452.1 hypothetical protein [Dyadobacter sp. LHD-138]